MGLQVPITLQQQYSLVCREIEYEVIPAALHNDIGLLPWSPVAGGFLSGKYERDHVLNAGGTRYGNGNAMFQYIGAGLAGAERNWSTLDAVRQIADDIRASPSQVALSWVTNRPAVSASIIGARTMKQLNDNLLATGLQLHPEAIAKLDKVSAPVPDEYPYGRFGSLQRERYIDSSEQALREL
jgi:aryl-alcohol dehydrogenase-like predicted oxidoreductase